MIHVCFGFDERMALGAYAAGASAIAATSKPLTIHFITPRPTVLIDRCAGLLRGQGAEVITHYVGDRAADLRCTEDFATPVFYRLLIPDLVGAPRAIYLDSDMVVAKDLSELEAMRLNGHPLAATIDWAMHLALNERIPYAGGSYILSDYLRDIVGTDPTSRRYFNSGLMLMDLERWRERDLSRQVINLIQAREHPFRWPDQCALNATIGEDYEILDPRWNSLVGWTTGREDLAKCADPWWTDVWSMWANDPWIMHFAAGYKPWIAEHARTNFDHHFWNAVHAFPAAELKQLLVALNKSPFDYVASLEAGITFARPGKPSFATAIHGFSYVEDWGRWTVGCEARIEFLDPLPDQFVVELVATSFGPNSGNDFVLEVGNCRSRLRVHGSGLKTYRALLSNPERSEILTIKVPQPTSPYSLGLSNDQRLLGLGLASLKIKPLNLHTWLLLTSARWMGAHSPV